MMSQSLAAYPLLQCVVAAAQFAAGEVAFYDAYAELMAADAEGGCTSPLRIDYDTLEHFRIVRAQCVMRLTMPRPVVRQWAALNGFAAQLEATEEEEEEAPSPSSSSTSAILLLQLRGEDMSNFLQSIAPLVASSRRTRSVSRLSVTEPLPLYAAVVDPAPDAAPDSRASSCTASLEQRLDAEGAREGDVEGDMDASSVSQAHKTAASTRWRAGVALLGSDASSATDSEGEHPAPRHRGHQQRQSVGVSHSEAERSPPAAATPLAAPPLLANTLESVEEELAGLLEDTQYASIYQSGTVEGRVPAKPLQRACPLLPPTATTAQVRMARGRKSAHNATAMSACPSLVSSATTAPPRGRAGLSSQQGGAANQPISLRTTAGKETAPRGRANRLVLAHLCASEKGSPSKASSSAVAAAEGVVDAAAETVGTVTCQQDRIQTAGETRRLRLTELSGEAAAPQHKAAPNTARGRTSSTVQDVRVIGGRGDGGAALHEAKKRAPPPRAASPPASPTSTRLGDLLGCDATHAVPAEHAVCVPSLPLRTATAAVADPTAAATPVLPGAPPSRKIAQAAPPVTAAVRRDVKSYLLDLFPPPSAAAAAATAAAFRSKRRTARPPAAPRQKGPPKSSRSGGAAQQQPAWSVAADKKEEKGVPSRGAPLDTASAAAPVDPPGVRRAPATRKRERSASCGAAERKVKPSSAARLSDCVEERSPALHTTGAAAALRRSSSVTDFAAKQRSEQLFMVEGAPPCFTSRTAIPRAEAAGGEEEREAAASRRSSSAAAAVAAADPVAAVVLPASATLFAPPTINVETKVLKARVRGAPQETSRFTTGNAVDADSDADTAQMLCLDMGSSSDVPRTPLFYRRDSRKERTRRVLRYMNVVSQSLATMHETHEQLRGLLLTMLSDDQL